MGGAADRLLLFPIHTYIVCVCAVPWTINGHSFDADTLRFKVFFFCSFYDVITIIKKRMLLRKGFGSGKF